MIPPKIDISFTRDARLAGLSFQARDLLRCLAEKFPVILTANGKVEVTAPYLRQQCYPDRTDIHDTHIGRWLKELSASSIVTLAPASRRSYWLSLDQRKGQALAPGSLPGAAHADDARTQRPQVIHISAGLSPPDQEKITAVAAAATDSSDLIARLREFFPQHDLAAELDRYIAYRKKQGRPPIATGFAKWMLRAEVPLTKVESKKSKVETFRQIAPPADAQLDLFDEAARRNFMAQFAERKKRKGI